MGTTISFVCIFIFSLFDLIFISLNILVFVPVEFFEEFANAIVFYPVNVESDIGLRNCPFCNTFT